MSSAESGGGQAGGGGVELLKFPHPYQAALTVASDIDNADWRRFAAVHALFGGRDVIRPGGLGLGLLPAFFTGPDFRVWPRRGQGVRLTERWMPLLLKTRIAWAMAKVLVGGWRCRRPVVVIESDDWGSLRTSSRADCDRLAALGCRMERSPYSLDALETDEDLDRLFEVLDSVKDSRGRPACMTANMVTANADFARIREADFSAYVYEPATVTLARSPARQGVARRYAEGLKRRLFVPQLHGREHIRWWEWLEALRAGSAEARITFEMGMCGVPLAASREGHGFFAPPYQDAETLSRHGVDLGTLVREGVELFEKQFGYRPLSTMAPGYTWTDDVERLWAGAGIRYIQGTIFHLVPTPGGERKRTHVLGERGAAGGLYLVRNAGFEPAEGRGVDWLARAAARADRALRFHKPAIIETHRMNFVGSIDPANRDRGLGLLAQLLRGLVDRRPDLVFLSSPELGYLVEHGEDAVDSLDDTAIFGNPSRHE
jgi:hypothetical protein